MTTGEVPEIYRVTARNTAPDSENRIHEDHTAAGYGFRAGLVPGVTVYGYMTVPVVRRYGEEWLRRGGMRLRLLQPAYDGDRVVVQMVGNTVQARRQDGADLATGEVTRPPTAAPALDQYPEKQLPSEKPLASAETLAPGTVLGTLRVRLSLPDTEFLSTQDERLILYEKGLMHPAALLSLSNHLLMQNVKLGPWLHVSSDLRHFDLARDGDELVLRGKVAECFERKGHQFVILDIIAVTGDRLIQQVRHTAIYRLRPPA
ncbi:MAG: hypothetical protein U0Q18_30420 [Bryobacteraceae bacterium]